MEEDFRRLPDRDVLLYQMRSGLAPGNVDPDSKYVPIKLAFQNLFFSDLPQHVFIVPASKIRYYHSLVMSKRGVSPLVYDELFVSEDDKLYQHIDSNFRANWSSFFFGSMDQPFMPYIMLASTKSTVAYLYFRKVGMTIFCERGLEHAIPSYDYIFDSDNQVAELITRPVYVLDFDRRGLLSNDLLVAPDYQDFIPFAKQLAERLSKKFSVRLIPYQYDTEINRAQQELPFDWIGQDKMIKHQLNYYYLSLLEAQTLLFRDELYQYNEPQRTDVIYKRRLIVAPSGTGKTFFIISRNGNSTDGLLVDADSIFEWPPTSGGKWWLDDKKKEQVNDRNLQLLQEWLAGPEDGKVIFYADDFSGRIIPEAVVVIPIDIHRLQLSQRGANGQADISDWERIAYSRLYLSTRYSDRLFENFSQALGYTQIHGRFRIQLSNRYTMRVVFAIPKDLLTDFRIQSCYSGQTYLVKSITFTASRFLNFGVNDMEVARRIAASQMGLYFIGNNRVGAFTKINGKVLPIAVSGHMVNYNILSHLIPLDYGRLWEQITWNMELSSSRRKLTQLETRFANAGFLAEKMNLTNIYHLWHSLPEWVVGYLAGRIFARFLGLPDVSVASILDALHTFKKLSKYKKAFAESIVIHQAISNGFIVGDWISKDSVKALRVWSIS